MLSHIISEINKGISSDSCENGDGSADSYSVQLTGSGHASSCFPVAEFSQSAIAAAIHELQRFKQSRWGISTAASVNRELAAGWCSNSVRPVGWPIPEAWDEFAGDYQCADGWIRLHTNAPHHRVAALGVLGNPATKQAAADAVLTWKGLELESAVVAAGGASAYMMSQQDWSNHAQGESVNSEPVVAWKQMANAASSNQKSDRHYPDNPARPLQGIKVLDLTRVLAGPVCTRFLASLGADVLRIDPPNWDEDGNALEMTVGKRCAGLDLNVSADRSTFNELLAQADVLVHGYRRDALQGLGYSDEERSAVNPNLIDVALNAFGWTGPWKNRRGFDSLVQMSSGLASRGQEAFGSEKPHPLPYQALDHVTGYLMAAAVIRALREKFQNGNVFSARLSLARQAKLLQDLANNVAPDQTSNSQSGDSEAHAQTTDRFPKTLPVLDETYLQPGIESTPWGELRRLKFPYEVEGVSLGFDHEVSRLRTSAANW